MRLSIAIITGNAEETPLCNKEFILWKKFTIQQCGALCHAVNSFTNYLNKNVPVLIISERKTDLIPVTSIYLICDLGHEKDTLQENKVI